MACETCRLKKIKCDQGRPKCRRCDLRQLPCHYDGERRRSRKLDAEEIEKRLHQMEGVFRHLSERFPTVYADIQQSGQGDTSRVEVPQEVPSPENHSTGFMPGNDQMEREHGELEYDWSFDESMLTAPQPVDNLHSPISGVDATGILTPITSSNDDSSKDQSLLDRILGGDPEYVSDDQNASVWIRTDEGDEYTGPSSGISLLSQPGLTWIRNTFSATEDICDTLETITKEVANHLQRPKCVVVKPWAKKHIHEARKPVPPAEIAWTYVDAYFKSVQCIFPVLDRHSFENRLRSYYQEPNDETDIAWTALMVSVIASGCRALLSTETPAAFEKSGTESFAYFQNAIDLISQIMYKPASITVLQALLVMTVYAQGLSSPQRLEYTFCALASQVAEGLGLHRNALPGWNLSQSDIRERNRLFWITYGLDKTISLRSGRPSLIDDNEISCHFPYGTSIFQISEIRSQASDRGSPPQRPQMFDFFFAYTQFARLCGKISKQLFSASALGRRFSDLTAIAKRLERDINKWRDGIPVEFRPGRPFRPSALPKDVTHEQALTLSFGYHYLICSVHRRFSPMFEQSEAQTTLSDSSRLSGGKYLEAARSMILLTKYLDIESHAPGWMLFYYPMTALLGVFTCVVSQPRSASGNNDIALMEVIVGHLGRLEFMTSGGTAFNKIGELVRLARLILSRTSQEAPAVTSSEPMVVEREVPTTNVIKKRSIDDGPGFSPSHQSAKRTRTTPQHHHSTPENPNIPQNPSLDTTIQTSEPSPHVTQSLHGGTTNEQEQNNHIINDMSLDFLDGNRDIFASQTGTPSFLREEERHHRANVPAENEMHWDMDHGAAQDLSTWDHAMTDQSYTHYDFGEVPG